MEDVQSRKNLRGAIKQTQSRAFQSSLAEEQRPIFSASVALLMEAKVAN